VKYIGFMLLRFYSGLAVITCPLVNLATSFWWSDFHRVLSFKNHGSSKLIACIVSANSALVAGK
jgi:hypothetical protein